MLDPEEEEVKLDSKMKYSNWKKQKLNKSYNKISNRKGYNSDYEDSPARKILRMKNQEAKKEYMGISINDPLRKSSGLERIDQLSDARSNYYTPNA